MSVWRGKQAEKDSLRHSPLLNRGCPKGRESPYAGGNTMRISMVSGGGKAPSCPLGDATGCGRTPLAKVGIGEQKTTRRAIFVRQCTPCHQREALLLIC